MSPLEREIKLRFDSPDTARSAVLAIGASPLRARRLQADALLDTPDDALKRTRCTLRVRAEPGRAYLTFKGAPQPSTMKLREELETTVGDAAILFQLLDRIGFHVWFRYEKYREEFSAADALIAVDDTPIGTFVEIEGSEAAIEASARALGRSATDYILGSYRALFVQHCTEQGRPPGDMLFQR